MANKVNLQYLLSYLGIFPIVMIIIDGLFFKKIPNELSNEFLINYLIVIFVFIGAINWNLNHKLSLPIIYLGFLQSLLSVFLIIFNMLFSNKVIILLLIINFLLVQLIGEYIIINKNYKKPFLFLRLPLTILISLLVVIILIL